MLDGSVSRITYAASNYFTMSDKSAPFLRTNTATTRDTVIAANGYPGMPSEGGSAAGSTPTGAQLP
jgi:hypothetical protein